jgi:hypothetical protein
VTSRVSLTVRVKGMAMSGKCATTLPSFGEREGRHLVLGVHPMLMVDTDAVVVERLLLAGELTCPACVGVLAPWGHARWRSSRLEVGAVRHQPRRASCKMIAAEPAKRATCVALPGRRLRGAPDPVARR